jgi:methylglutaconyl-CoA hydratase
MANKMPYDTLEITRDGAVSTLWLNRVDVRNAFSDVMIGELHRAVDELTLDAGTRVIVLAARGSVFSAGADLNWMRRMAEYSQDENRADAEKLAQMLHALYTCPKPTIARVHGDCYAGGLGLVAACDIAVAAAPVTFCLTEVRIGLIPATIGPYVVRAMGQRRASRYFLTAEKFSAAEAHQMDFVHKVSEPAELDQAIAELTTMLLQASPAALAAAKRQLRDLQGRPIDAAVGADMAARIAAIRASDEGREGVAAFLGKRKPRWVGDRS